MYSFNVKKIYITEKAEKQKNLKNMEKFLKKCIKMLKNINFANRYGKIGEKTRNLSPPPHSLLIQSTPPIS